MNLSKPQQQMFSELTKNFQSIYRLPGRNQFQTARSLDKRGLALLEPCPDDWVIRLSDDWIRLEHLERVINSVEGTSLENTPAHKVRVQELDVIYAKLR